MVPWSGVSNPATIRNNVVFPDPEGPSMVKNSPSRISRLMSWSTVVPAKDFATPRMSIAESLLTSLPTSRDFYGYHGSREHAPEQGPMRATVVRYAPDGAGNDNAEGGNDDQGCRVPHHGHRG